MKFNDDMFEKLFVVMTLGLNNVNLATYVAGKKVYDRARKQTHMYASEIPDTTLSGK